jgi:hypothetical protein
VLPLVLVLPLVPLLVPLLLLASLKLSKRQRKANKVLLRTDNTLKRTASQSRRIQTRTAGLVTCTHTHSTMDTLHKSLVLVRRFKPLKAAKDLLDAICLCFTSQTT